MTLEAIVCYLLVAQGVMGGVDTLLNHEIIAKLPRQVSARREIGLHAMRELNYAALFIGVGWFDWNGAMAYVIGALLLLEVGITANDEFVENRTRVLPQNERVLHVFLTLNYGLILALIAPTLVRWGYQPTGIARAPQGWTSWALLALGVASVAWAVRDFIAWRRLTRLAAAA